MAGGYSLRLFREAPGRAMEGAMHTVVSDR